MSFRRVVFPQPLGPTIETNSRSPTLNVTSSSAWTKPSRIAKDLDRCSQRNDIASSAGRRPEDPAGLDREGRVPEPLGRDHVVEGAPPHGPALEFEHARDVDLPVPANRRPARGPEELAVDAGLGGQEVEVPLGLAEVVLPDPLQVCDQEASADVRSFPRRRGPKATTECWAPGRTSRRPFQTTARPERRTRERSGSDSCPRSSEPAPNASATMFPGSLASFRSSSVSPFRPSRVSRAYSMKWSGVVATALPGAGPDRPRPSRRGTPAVRRTRTRRRRRARSGPCRRRSGGSRRGRWR